MLALLRRRLNLMGLLFNVSSRGCYPILATSVPGAVSTRTRLGSERLLLHWSMV
jgi:hypothetical protein